VLDYTFKGHLDNSTTHSHLIIHNVTIDMHGKYRCWVRTDLGTHQNELDVVVVSRSPCKLDDWRITSQQTECRETLRFDCRHMFPKPKPSCGLWDSRSEKFIRSVPIDISEDTPLPTTSMQTYRVRYVNRFELNEPEGSSSSYKNTDLLRYADHLVFKCDIFVPETSWKLSISHKMFHFSDGCEQDPLEAIRRMRASYKQYVRQRLQHADGQLNSTADKERPVSKQEPQHAGHRAAQHLKTVDDQHSVASFDLELLLPSEVRKLARQNRLGGPGEADMDPNSTYSSSGTGNNNDLNCWKKPRLGSIVKLSCADDRLSSHSLAGGTRAGSRRGNQHQHRHHQPALKLMGSNLLECTPNGWQLIRESNLINNEILDKKTYKVRVNRRRMLAMSLWPQANSSRQTAATTASRPAAASTTAATMKTTTMDPGAFVTDGGQLNTGERAKTHDNLIEDNDDDDNSNGAAAHATITPVAFNSSQWAPPQISDSVASATTTTITSSDWATANPAQSPTSATTEQEDDEFEIGVMDWPRSTPTSELLPEQLADLLPSCVSVSQKRRNYYQKPGPNGLPLLESGAVMDGAADGRRFRMSNDGQPIDNNAPVWKWYSISSSGAGSGHWPLTKAIADTSAVISQARMMALIVCCLAALMTAATLSQPVIRLEFVGDSR
jgi:hypothetical protein